MKRITAGLAAVLLAVVSTEATAHDFWLEPQSFRIAAGEPASITLQVGDGAERQRSPMPLRRITRFGVVSPGGAYADLRAALLLGQGDADARLPLPAPGVHVVMLETDNGGRSQLPADRFNAYLEAEGLTSIIAHRRAAGQSGAAASERYGRRAKMLIQVSDGGASSAVTRPLGMTLEIVPQADPYAPSAGGELPVRVLYEGEPLAGALVKLADLDAGGEVREARRTDAEGGAVFKAPGRGAWRLNVVWSKVLPAGEDADFETVFSSLTFGGS